MSWFGKLCRNTGLMIHYAIKPLKKSQKQVIRKEVEETKIDKNTTFRRTVIEEIEVKPDNGESDAPRVR